MEIAVIGVGYVGLVSGACFAEIGHGVVGIDIDKEKIHNLQRGKSSIYEPGLNDILKRNLGSGRLQFSQDYAHCKKSEIIFLAVGTPSTSDGQVNLEYLKSAAEEIIPYLSEGTLIVIKSTVPVGTASWLKNFIVSQTGRPFTVINNPEFLKEGNAIQDFMHPDRIVVGTCDQKAQKTMEELYAPLLRQGNPIYHMSNISAEMTKYVANCFLATKISFINEMAKLCDLAGADIEDVRSGISSDRRIGRDFLYPSSGYGGSCFPKDVSALICKAREYGLELKIAKATEEVNSLQKIYMYEKISQFFKEDLAGKSFAFWGVAFKANTDDIRESAAIFMAQSLIKAGAAVCFYDPVASLNYLDFMNGFPECRGKIHHFEDQYKCLEHCDGLVVMTEWSEFKNPNFELMKKKLNTSVIFDARNLFSTKKVLKHGFSYRAIGKKIPSQ